MSIYLLCSGGPNYSLQLVAIESIGGGSLPWWSSRALPSAFASQFLVLFVIRAFLWNWPLSPPTIGCTRLCQAGPERGWRWCLICRGAAAVLRWRWWRGRGRWSARLRASQGSVLRRGWGGGAGSRRPWFRLLRFHFPFSTYYQGTGDQLFSQF